MSDRFSLFPKLRRKSFFSPLPLILILGLVSSPLIAKAVDDPSTPFEGRELPDFWIPAQEVVQEQIYLIRRIDRALLSPDPKQTRLVRAQIFLQTSAIDRFLKSYYQFPSLLCGQIVAGGQDVSEAIGSLNSAEQARVYCLIYASSQKLDSLRSVLDRRFAMLGGVTDVTTPRLPAITDPAEPPLIGRIAKQPIADYTAPIPPAIAPPVEATTSLDTVKTFIAQARQNFPRGTPFNDPAEAALISDRSNYTFYPIEYQPYAKLLALPNTGIARIFNAELYRQDPNLLRNRLLPTFSELFPFTPLLKENNRNSDRTFTTSTPFTPRLEIQIANNNFQIVPKELNYGFLTDLGDIAIESLGDNPQILSTPKQQFFLNYRPPQKLAQLEIDRRRFITGKEQNFGLAEPILTEAPVILNHTYLLRTIQFQLPEFVLTGERLNRNQRRNLALFLETPSSDLLVAFRPVYRRLDGSYTVVWRILREFSNPQIEDLVNYVDLERSVQ